MPGNKSDLSEIARQYDASFYARQEGKVRRLINCYIKEFKISGLENIKSMKDSAKIYMSNHRSHLDYSIIASILYRNKFKPPAIGAGNNMFVWPLGNYIKKLKAFPIKRTNDDFKTRKDKLRDLEELYDYVKNDLILKGEDILLFPEGGRSYNGEMGKIGGGQMIFIRSILDAQDGLEEPINIVPVGIKYDFVQEKAFFQLLKKSREIKNKSLSKILYYGADIGAFAVGMVKGAFGIKSDVYVNFGNPINVRDFLIQSNSNPRRELADLVMKEINKLVK
ncbi:MAG: 1-acyl-sn-glycerol-3-phosphate acyltransferase [Candidatus Woesearchaeota archaeon]|nr:1-acyl-sn-glycerol-3-phosphate acyltransferase [Candidatus Woesearchaeota archaeon]